MFITFQDWILSQLCQNAKQQLRETWEEEEKDENRRMKTNLKRRRNKKRRRRREETRGKEKTHESKRHVGGEPWGGRAPLTAGNKLATTPEQKFFKSLWNQCDHLRVWITNMLKVSGTTKQKPWNILSEEETLYLHVSLDPPSYFLDCGWEKHHRSPKCDPDLVIS